MRISDWSSDVCSSDLDYLKSDNLPPKLRLAPRDDLRHLPWDSAPLLEVEEGIAEADDATSLTGAFAGIAETGTLMMASGPEAPTTLNFLPENHIVVLRDRKSTRLNYSHKCASHMPSFA